MAMAGNAAQQPVKSGSERDQEREGFANADNRPGLETLLGREILAWNKLKAGVYTRSKIRAILLVERIKTWTMEFTSGPYIGRPRPCPSPSMPMGLGGHGCDINVHGWAWM